MICELISKYIEHLGYDIIVTYDGNQGWDKYQTEQPDLVITDINHYGIEGLELLKRIRIVNQVTSVIVMTGNEPEKHKHPALETGASAFIAKPFKWDDLEKQIYNLISK